MNISVIAPIPRALAHTKRVLFRPFDLGKWFTLGFTAFIALLGDGGSGVGSGFNFRTGSGGDRNINFEQIITFVADHIMLIGAIAVVVIVLVLALSALLLWLGSRGKFMLLDNVAHNRAEVVTSWNTFRTLGNSLFGLRFATWVVTLVVMLGIIAGAVAVAWPNIVEHVMGPAALCGLIGGGAGILLLTLAAWIFKVLVSDFVVPVMYVRNVSVWAALRLFAGALLWPHLGAFIVCFLLMLGINIALMVALLLVGVLTCCIGCCLISIPYIGTVVLLPLFVYDRAYTLYFLEQFGAQWRVIETETPAALIT